MDEKKLIELDKNIHLKGKSQYFTIADLGYMVQCQW